jgi:hypothetical protein
MALRTGALLVALAVALVLVLTGCTSHPASTASGDGGADATAAGFDGGPTTSSDACTPFDAGPLDQDALQPGADLVTLLKCRECHGDDLSGNPGGVQSPQTEGGLAYPPNITPDPATGLGCWTDQQVLNAFMNGVDDTGRSLCPPMPRFGEAGVDAASAHEILAYLRSVPAHYGTVPETPACSLAPLDAGDAASDAPSD